MVILIKYKGCRITLEEISCYCKTRHDRTAGREEVTLLNGDGTYCRKGGDATALNLGHQASHEVGAYIAHRFPQD